MKVLYSILILIILGIIPSYAQTHTVSMVDNEFVPADITVQEGDTVFWVNDGSNIHTTTSGVNCTSDGTWNSGDMGSGQQFAFIFSNAGDYPYFCEPHCGLGMDGSVTVEATSSNRSFITREVSVFPNPVSDRLQIVIDEESGQLLEYYMTDIKGYRILVSKGEAMGNSFVDLSGLAPGIYFLHLLMEDDHHTVKRVMKVN